MNHYTTLAGQLKELKLNFTENLCEGLSRPVWKFISNMLFGLLKGQSVMLTDISRSLCERIALKKTVDRLSRMMTKFTDREKGILMYNYTNEVKPSIDNDTIFCLDPGDLAKLYSRRQEGLCKIWDASLKKSVNGYKLTEVVALTHKSKLPIPVYSELHSTEESDYDGTNGEVLKALYHLDKHFGDAGITAADRGMDDVKIYKYCGTKKRFVIRTKVNRNVIYKGELWNIEDLANQFSGKIKLQHKDKYGKQHSLRMWHIQVELPEVPGREFTLLIVHGYDKKDPEPCLLLTNMDGNGKQKSQRILKIYLCRWRIEEYYRFKKTQFGLENVRVMSLNSIKLMNLLVSILTGKLAMLAAKRGQSLLLEQLFYHAKRVYEIPQFTLYAVADGIYAVLAKTFVGIAHFLKSKPQSEQLTLLEYSRIRRFAH